MRLNPDLLDLEQAEMLNVGGRGGQEGDVSRPLPGWTRVNAPLHDYQKEVGNELVRLEVKKQANLQWFDSGKYHELSATDRRIRMMFLIHTKGRIDTIAVSFLGDSLDWLCVNRTSDGWNPEVMAVAAEFKQKHPTLQFKAQAHVATIVRTIPHLFDIPYSRA